jgi:hypothetical protein
MPKTKIDLTILRRLIDELEASIGRAEEIQTRPTLANHVDWVVELNKATGLMAGVLIEAGLLMGDIQHSIASAGGTGDASKQDFIKQLLGGLKGSGSSN